jgi:hypothetical protein
VRISKVTKRILALGRVLRYLIVALTSYVSTTADNTVPDLRVERLETFFASFGCPAPHHAAEYIRAADVYQVDYRLLPAISVLESTCGAYGRMNNNWGWNRAQNGFSSVPAGIAFVTSRLAVGPPYKDKGLDEKLFNYNPEPKYARQVKHLMREIEPQQVTQDVTP